MNNMKSDTFLLGADYTYREEIVQQKNRWEAKTRISRQQQNHNFILILRTRDFSCLRETKKKTTIFVTNLSHL